MSDAPGPSVTQGEVWTAQQWNAFFASLAGKVDAVGGSAANLTISGGASVTGGLTADNITVASNPTAAMQVAPKQYVDKRQRMQRTKVWSWCPDLIPNTVTYAAGDGGTQMTMICVPDDFYAVRFGYFTGGINGTPQSFTVSYMAACASQIAPSNSDLAIVAADYFNPIGAVISGYVTGTSTTFNVTSIAQGTLTAGMVLMVNGQGGFTNNAQIWTISGGLLTLDRAGTGLGSSSSPVTVNVVKGGAAWSPVTAQNAGIAVDRIVTNPSATLSLNVAASSGYDPYAGSYLNTPLTGVNGLSWSFSDWSPCVSDMPDKNTGMRVLMCRAFFPAGQTVTFSQENLFPSQDQSVGGIYPGYASGWLNNPSVNNGYDFWHGGVRFGNDLISTTAKLIKSSQSGTTDTLPSGGNLLSNAPYYGPCAPLIQVMTKNSGIIGYVAADSQFQGSYTAGQFNNLLTQACTTLGKQNVGIVPYGFANLSRAGMTTGQWAPRFHAALPFIKPSFALIPVYSGNDMSVGQLQQYLDTAFALAMEEVQACVAAGVVPILVTPPPEQPGSYFDSIGLSAINMQRQRVLDQQGSGVLVLDATALLSNPISGGYDFNYKSAAAFSAYAAGNSLIVTSDPDGAVAVGQWLCPNNSGGAVGQITGPFGQTGVGTYTLGSVFTGHIDNGAGAAGTTLTLGAVVNGTGPLSLMPLYIGGTEVAAVAAWLNVVGNTTGTVNTSQLLGSAISPVTFSSINQIAGSAGAPVAMTTSLLAYDNVHPNDAGHAVLVNGNGETKGLLQILASIT